MDKTNKYIYDKQWRLDNKDKVAKHFKKYWDKDKDKVNKKRRKYYAENREKMLEKVKKWQRENPEKAKMSRKKWQEKNPDYRKKFKEKYPEKFKAQRFKSLMWRIDVDMTYEEFEQMLKKQDNRCAICGEKETKRRMSVDHCHKNGNVRGLLCQKCNIALGLFNDNTELLERAIKYLTKKR